ncbi:hypothetical protein T03_6912 [Trichinella britovi]|uniref:CCHC-type domain-containing protein n=1 Tax=Trichinella britovi TaxID=45882 RepID=A0A0V1C9T5_TRIBR|nr:hypothetical protein T03_6912 [Trichinella britovi]
MGMELSPSGTKPAPDPYMCRGSTGDQISVSSRRCPPAATTFPYIAAVRTDGAEKQRRELRGHFAEAASADEVENADEMLSRRRERRLEENLVGNCAVRNPESGTDPVVTLGACLGNGTEGSRSRLLGPDTEQLLRGAQTPQHTAIASLRFDWKCASAVFGSSRTSPSVILHEKWPKWDAGPENQGTNWSAILSSARRTELRLRQPATLVKARQLAECVTEIEEGRRRAADDGLDRAVEALARRLDKLEATRDRPSRLRPAQRAMECFYCGGLGHIQRNCPQLHVRTWPASTQSSRTRDRCLLAMSEFQARRSPSVTELPGVSPWGLPEAPSYSTSGGGCASAAREYGRSSWEIGEDRYMSQWWRTWSYRGSQGQDCPRIDQAACPSIRCARITPLPYEVPREETGGVGPETDNGDLEACKCALVDGAECSAQTQREVMDRLMREMLQAGVIEPAAGT